MKAIISFFRALAALPEIHADLKRRQAETSDVSRSLALRAFNAFERGLTLEAWEAEHAASEQEAAAQRALSDARTNAERDRDRDQRAAAAGMTRAEWDARIAANRGAFRVKYNFWHGVTK